MKRRIPVSILISVLLTLVLTACAGAAELKLTASDGAANDWFGYSVSISGDYAIVGAYSDDDDGSASGSAYIFKWNGTSWSEQAKITASDGAAGDWFGYSVSISGDYAIVGACNDDDDGSASGSAYIFKWNGTSWSEQAKITASDGAASDWFGYSVSISGDYAIVGACNDDDSGSASGSAYIFKWNDTSWSEQAKITASDGATDDRFGISTSISGDYAIVGACNDDDSGSDSGSAYIFKWNGTSWSEQAKITASDGAASDCFGISTSISGDYAIVGAYFDDDGGSASGSAYIFKRDGTSWSEQAKITASDGAASDCFGISTSISGDYAIVGAYFDDDGSSASGSAYVYDIRTIPSIISSAPESPVNDSYGTWTKFNVSVDQTVNVTWYLDDTPQTPVNERVTEANYTFHADDIREHNVSALAKNANGTDMQTWVWNVTGETIPPEVTIDTPSTASQVRIPGGEQFWVNFTYTELYPANYTVTVGTGTAVINSTTNDSPTGGTSRTVNESFNLNASAADGWYNVTVEMYDNSSNYNITHQNNSVEKGSYDDAISQPENQTTELGVNATYELNITNTGILAGTFTLAVTNHNGADVAALNKTTIADLAIGASQNVTLNVTDASAGTYNVTVNVTSTDSGSEVAETGYIMTTVVGPALALDNVNDITRDWGINFNVNHSVRVTNANADDVNVTYNVSWVEGCAFGTVNKDATEWCNQTRQNSTVQKITVKVDATTTTASTTNDSETFNINITRRAIIITSDPVAPQSVNPNTTFWINGSAEGNYSETFIGKADLIRDGSIIENQPTTDGNANFSRTESAEGTFNFSIRFYNTTHYNNKTTIDATMHIVDDTPPASITGLDNRTEQSCIRWTWTDPKDADFTKVMIYLDGTFKTNVSEGAGNYTATGLDPDTNYTIGTHTVDDKGNINQTWENDTARTLPLSGLQRINVTPDSWTMNVSESMNFNATGFYHNDDPIDPSNLTFAWYTTPSGVGTLNATTGSVVNFTARHAGRTELYAVNGSISSNATDSVWITVNSPPETENVANGTGNATSGNSTAIVTLNNRSVNGTITIEEIGDPINGTEDIGNRTGLGTDSEPIKGANVTVNGSIEVALNAMGGYVHIRIEYNESQLGNIDENTLYIYKFVNGTGWVKLVKGNPSYCIANGRNTTADYVWVNVTECSTFMLAGTGVATPTPSGGSGGEGTYPPGWFGTPAPAVTATKAPAASTTATAVPPGERVTPAPTKTKPAAAGTTAEDAKKGLPGFTAVFVIAGMLAVAYMVMRRRE